MAKLVCKNYLFFWKIYISKVEPRRKFYLALLRKKYERNFAIYFCITIFVKIKWPIKSFPKMYNLSNLSLKELSFCHKLRFSNSYNLATRFPRPLIFPTINSGRSNSLSLKYQRCTPSDIGVRKCNIVAKTQFLYPSFNVPQDRNTSVCI